jgi:16S rRNA (guanine527-N7)-methyltransferase
MTPCQRIATLFLIPVVAAFVALDDARQILHQSSLRSSTSSTQLFSSTSVDFAMNPTSEEARKIVREQLGLSMLQYKQLAALAVLVVDWNNKINLVSRKDCTPDVVFGRHILPSLAACKTGIIQDKAEIVDVGTGGGFPGLPLAIAYPDCDFLLVDSIGKKLTAVQDMADQLGLKNVKTYHGRAEILQSHKYDLCVGRSVAAIPTYCFWIHKLLKKGTGKLLYMIGGDIEQELLEQAELDQDIDDLLEYPGASDKRVLVFPQAAVARIAAASGEKIRVQDLRSSGKNNKNGKAKPAKGEWKKRDPASPKPRGYENFKRFDSLKPE